MKFVNTFSKNCHDDSFEVPLPEASENNVKHTLPSYLDIAKKQSPKKTTV